MTLETTHLERIEKELAHIRKNTNSTWWRLLLNGVLQGAGFLLGTILCIALGGWILSLLGVIPGFGDITHNLHVLLQAHAGVQ